MQYNNYNEFKYTISFFFFITPESSNDGFDLLLEYDGNLD